MLVDIYASILKPPAGDGDILVIVAGFAAEAGGAPGTFPNRRGQAKDTEEAKVLARRLAEDLRRDLERLGHDVRSVNLRA